MQIKPVITKKQPEYPTEYLFINNPELFKRYIPLRWYKNKVVCTALTAFILAGTTNCYSQSTKSSTEITTSNESAKQTNPNEQKSDTVKVAPIFVHGDGSGAVGCMVISPPVFITESEAIQIIKEELRKENIIIDTNNCPNFNFQANAIANDSYFDNAERIASIDMKVDGIDKEHKFMIEFISTDDYSLFKTKPLPTDNIISRSSVRGFRTKQAAEIVRDELVEKSIYNAVVFYDPIYRDDNDDEMSEEQKLTKSKEQLVAQVSDFINWMKTEGIIK